MELGIMIVLGVSVGVVVTALVILLYNQMLATNSINKRLTALVVDCFNRVQNYQDDINSILARIDEMETNSSIATAEIETTNDEEEEYFSPHNFDVENFEG